MNESLLGYFYNNKKIRYIPDGSSGVKKGKKIIAKKNHPRL
jgi:hypothetical protein